LSESVFGKAINVNSCPSLLHSSWCQCTS